MNRKRLHERMGVTKAERRYLRDFECEWCGQTLDKFECGAIFAVCTEEERAARRKAVLQERITK
jgi:hypothetical protein